MELEDDPIDPVADNPIDPVVDNSINPVVDNPIDLVEDDSIDKNVFALLVEIALLIKEDAKRLATWDLEKPESNGSNSELYQFVNECLTSLLSWQSQFIERIELVFGTCLPYLESDPGCRYSRRDWVGVSMETRTRLLMKILMSNLTEDGFNARLAYLLDKLRLTMSIETAIYMDKVEGEMAVQIKGSQDLDSQQSLLVQRTRKSQVKKGALIGLGAVVGGVTVGVTAGLAAPAVIPFFASMMGISTGLGFLAGATGAALFGTLFGAGGAGLAGYRVGRRYRDISSFNFIPLCQNNVLRVAIGFSGWLAKYEDLYEPWTALVRPGSDVYVLECEKKTFLELGSALENLITSSAVSYASFQLLMGTALSTALSALMWPITLLQAASFIDNPWSVCLNIAKKAALVLADAIRSRAHGHRPLTLAGFSLGALTIFLCLVELSKDPSLNLGVIENVVLFGLPAEIAPIDRWHKARMLVAGRFIHCYSENDWILKFLFRSTSFAIGDLAGVNPIRVVGLENVNMSNFVKGHLEYAEKVPEMLKLFNL